MSTTTTTGPLFTAGGLASGLDTTSIINNLVAAQSATLTSAQSSQAAYKTQISAVADLVSKLQDLHTATTALKTGGVLGTSQVGTDTGFTATPAAGAAAGTYSVQVTSLASAAKARSAAFTSGTTVTGSTLALSVNGSSYSVDVADGSTLETVAGQINQSGAPVIASVLTTTNGTQYLSVVNQQTGFTPGQDPSTALQVTETVTGSQGQALGLAVFQPATNAHVSVDGLDFERSNNLISDALPGVSLTLKQLTAAPEALTLATDSTATQTNLQKFVDAYNTVMGAINSNLSPPANANRSATLANNPALRSLQGSLQRLVSGVLNPGASGVRTLADVGVGTKEDGSLTIDSTRLGKALASDPTQVNALFQTATSGLGDSVAALDKTYTDTVDGIFTATTKGLNANVSILDNRISNLQQRLADYRTSLTAQFTAMENVVANFKSAASYLTAVANAKLASSNNG